MKNWQQVDQSKETPLPPFGPASVVPWEAFEELRRRVTELERKVEREEKLRLSRTLLSTKEACGVLHLSKSSILRLERKGELISIRNGKKIQYRVDSIREYLQKHTLDPAEIENRLQIAFHLP